MTCAYDGCERASVGTVVWETESEPAREYCQKHLRDTKIDFPELVKEVQLT